VSICEYDNKLMINLIKQNTNLRPPRWLSVDVTSVLGWLYRVGVGDVADVREKRTPSMFRVEVCRVGEFLYMYTDKCFVNHHGRKSGCW
jgi:hypothetical protein